MTLRLLLTLMITLISSSGYSEEVDWETHEQKENWENDENKNWDDKPELIENNITQAQHKAIDALLQRPNNGLPSSRVKDVNVITGVWSPQFVDLQLPGPHGLKLTRSGSFNVLKENVQTHFIGKGWRFLEYCSANFLGDVNIYSSKYKRYGYVCLEFPNGCFRTYNIDEYQGNKGFVEIIPSLGYSNISEPCIGAKHNLVFDKVDLSYKEFSKFRCVVYPSSLKNRVVNNYRAAAKYSHEFD